MKNQSNAESLKPTDEELPIEELDGIVDWNASAWARIQSRDTESLRNQEAFARHLSALPMSALDSSFAVLNRTNQNIELKNAIAMEIERRIDATDSEAAQ